MKKKKKKKTTFDFEAALDENIIDSGINDFDDNLDLENIGKKKKKKKPFNLEDLENTLPTEIEETTEDGGNNEGGNVEDDYDLDVDFSKTKKKKKKKKDLDELVAEKIEEDIQINKENGKCTFLVFSFCYVNRINFIIIYLLRMQDNEENELFFKKKCFCFFVFINNF